MRKIRALYNHVENGSEGPHKVFEEMRTANVVAGIISCVFCLYLLITIIFAGFGLSSFGDPNPTEGAITLRYVAIGMLIGLGGFIWLLVWYRRRGRESFEKEVEDGRVISYSETLRLATQPVESDVINCNLCKDTGICSACQGTGMIDNFQNCGLCNGTGVCSCQRRSIN